MPFALPFDYLAVMTGWLAALGLGGAGLWWLHRRWRSGSRGRRLCVRAGLAAWTLLAALTIAELSVAIGFDQTDSFNCTNVSKHWWTRHVVPDIKTLRFADGRSIEYRDRRALPLAPGDGQELICVVGDSFAFGYGVANCADRLSDRLGAALQARQPGRFRVANLSDAGRDADWIAWLVGELIENRVPVRTVVYVLCLNDIEPFSAPSEALNAEIRAIRPRSLLVARSYFINLLYYRLQLARARHIGGYYDFLHAAYAADSPAWLALRGQLEELRRRCADAGIELRVAVFPFLQGLGPGYRFAEAHRLLVEYGRESGLPVLDLYPVLEPHARKGLTANRFDAHPNERAHALAAAAIERELLADLAGPPGR